MRRFFLILTALLWLTELASAQTVDSIKVEQAGDFIKIRYKILNSVPGQLYRVKVLCSINGGLNSEIRSVSGDVGDNVAGGRSEYWVIWDVLKDVEEVKSVEFVVRAELMPQINTNITTPSKLNTTGWDKKRFHIAFAFEYPGPKMGARLGYMGSIGITGKILKGPNIMDDGNATLYDYLKSTGQGDNLDLDNEPSVPMYGLGGTVRVANKGVFQAHLMLGAVISEFRFIEQVDMTTFSMTDHKLISYEVGLFFDISRLTVTTTFSHFDPKKEENGSNKRCWSNRTFFDMCLGVRF